MSRWNRFCLATVAAVVAAVSSVKTAGAVDPLGGFRDEPYASVSSNSAVQVGKTVFLN